MQWCHMVFMIFAAGCQIGTSSSQPSGFMAQSLIQKSKAIGKANMSQPEPKTISARILAEGGESHAVVKRAVFTGYQAVVMVVTLPDNSELEAVVDPAALSGILGAGASLSSLVGTDIVATYQVQHIPYLLSLESEGTVIHEADDREGMEMPTTAKKITGKLSIALDHGEDQPAWLTLLADSGAKVRVLQFLNAAISSQNGKFVTLTYDIGTAISISALKFDAMSTKPRS
jgi:hypothetical protein